MVQWTESKMSVYCTLSLALKVRVHTNAIAENSTKSAVIGSVEMLHEPGHCSITIKTQGGTIQAWVLVLLSNVRYEPNR
jgi:hypothetical protein